MPHTPLSALTKIDPFPAIYISCCAFSAERCLVFIQNVSHTFLPLILHCSQLKTLPHLHKSNELSPHFLSTVEVLYLKTIWWFFLYSNIFWTKFIYFFSLIFIFILCYFLCMKCNWFVIFFYHDLCLKDKVMVFVAPFNWLTN